MWKKQTLETFERKKRPIENEMSVYICQNGWIALWPRPKRLKV